jgi:glycosyltransferase involved in cell wall biosynthesis
MKITVAIPCYNEAATIAKVVADFRRELPEAEIIVLDNNSTDGTGEIARAAGASVVRVRRQGKGAVVRHIFRTMESDVCLMADGDDTYPAESARELIFTVASGEADMAVGDRLSGGVYAGCNKRPFHNFGNALVRALVNRCFGSRLNDIMSGYRAFNRRFAQNVPILSDGFEVETEMTVRCLDRNLVVAEIPVAYRDRPAGSVSKLRTFRDGWRVLRTFFGILKNYRPLFFFGSLAAAAFAAGLASGFPVLAEFAATRYITHVPLAVLATGFMMTSMITLACALILDAIASAERSRNESAIARGKSS